MKKILFFSFVLFFSFSGFAADPVATNEVTLTSEQYEVFANDLCRIVNSISNIVQILDFQLSSIPDNTDSISAIQSSVDNLHSSFDEFMGLFKLSGSPTPKLSLSSLNNGGSLSAPNQGLTNLGKALSLIANNVLGSVYAIRVFTSGNINAYDASTYNFIELFKMIDSLSKDLSDFQADCRSYFSDILDILDDSFYHMLNDSLYSLNKIRTELLPLIVDVAQAGTNQLQTIIYIIEGMTNRVETATNQFEVVSNLLADISSDLGYIKDNFDSAGGGAGSGGSGSGSAGPADLSYFDRWMKDWLQKYFYPDDSQVVFEINQHGNLVYRYTPYGDWIGDRFVNTVLSFDVPFLGFNKWHNGGFVGLEVPTPLDRPHWKGGFDNTLQAYNSGHTNFYDLTSALLTDIQSVNSQNYALFYVLATNILLQTATIDTQQITNEISQLEHDREEAQEDVENLKSDLEYKFTQLKDKYDDLRENTKTTMHYFGSLARLPTNDYYFNLPNLEIGQSEFGGMQIVLPLTSTGFVMIVEIVHFLSLCMLWALCIGLVYFMTFGVIKMFVLLFKFFIFLGAIGSE